MGECAYELPMLQMKGMQWEVGVVKGKGAPSNAKPACIGRWGACRAGACWQAVWEVGLQGCMVVHRACRQPVTKPGGEALAQLNPVTGAY